MNKILTIISLATILGSATVSAHNKIPQERFVEIVKQNLEKYQNAPVGDSWTTTITYKGDCPYTEITVNQIIKSVNRGVLVLEKSSSYDPEKCTRGYSEEQIVYRSTNAIIDFTTSRAYSHFDVTDLGNNKFKLESKPSRATSTLDFSVPFYRVRTDQIQPGFHESVESHGIKPVELKNEDIEICSLVPTAGLGEGESYLCAMKNPYDFLDL